MKRLLAYLFIVIILGLTFSVSSNGKEINKEFYKFKKILIPLSKDGSWKLIGKKTQNIYSAKLTWIYLAQTKDNQLSKLIELIHMTAAAESVTESISWFKNFVYQKNGYKSCIPKNTNAQPSTLRENYYVYEESEKSKGCFFTRNMDIEKEILHPTIKRKTTYIDTNHFSAIVKKYINNKSKFPKIMLRSDHYFSSQKELYGYFEMINPDVNGAPNTLFKSEKKSEYHPLNIDNHPLKKNFYLTWIKSQAKKHLKFETELKRKYKIDLAKYINFEPIKDVKDSPEITIIAEKESKINTEKKVKDKKGQEKILAEEKKIVKIVKSEPKNQEIINNNEIKVDVKICVRTIPTSKTNRQNVNIVKKSKPCPGLSFYFKIVKYKDIPKSYMRVLQKKNICYNENKSRIKIRRSNCKEEEFYLKYKELNNEDIFYYETEKTQISEIDQNKNNEKKSKDKLSKKKIIKKEKKNNKEKKFKDEYTDKEKAKYSKLEIDAKNYTKIIKKNESEVHIIQTEKFLFDPSYFAAAKHCAQFKKFAFTFWGGPIGDYDPTTRKNSEYFICSKDFLIVSPIDGKKLSWSNYDDTSFYKNPDQNIYKYRKFSKISKKKIKEAKKKDPEFFKKSKKENVNKVLFKNEKEIHIKAKLLDLTLKKPSMIAEEHCSKYDKYWYYSADDLNKGKNASVVFHCSKKTLLASPLTSGQITFSNDPSLNNTASVSSSSQTMSANYNSSQLKTYNASSMTTYYFFESSHNFMSSLELLYRAYDENTKADELKAQINYNKQSKYTETQKLKSTKSIIDSSSIQITANLQDASIILSDLGRSYYEQALPYAYNAATNAYNLFMTVKNTKDNVTSSGDLFTGLIENLGEVLGFATIAPQIPQFTRNMIDTSKLIFNGAKVKKIKDKGNLNKALDELTLD